MDALLTLFVIAGIVTSFAMMVRRTISKGKGLALAASQNSKPELLTPQQRKALNLQERKRPAATKPSKLITSKSVSNRAIRTGWSMGIVAFTYKDSAGDISYRTVTVHSANTTYLKGECHERQAERTFRLDRIIGDITNCETGEILVMKKWANRHKDTFEFRTVFKGD